MTETRNEYGVIGLGRMGGNLARQALEKAMRVVGFTRHGFGSHPYGPSEAEVRERREGRIGSFLREYTEAPRS
jgi:6-phosphogluconate dehydrogenase (decarboxylating)